MGEGRSQGMLCHVWLGYPHKEDDDQAFTGMVVRGCQILTSELILENQKD